MCMSDAMRREGKVSSARPLIRVVSDESVHVVAVARILRTGTSFGRYPDAAAAETQIRRSERGATLSSVAEVRFQRGHQCNTDAASRSAD